MKNSPVEFVDSALQRLDQRRHRFNLKYKSKILLIKYVPALLLLMSKVWYIAILWWLVATVFLDHRKIFGFDPVVRIWFGVPGSGKTSMAALLSRFSQKEGYRVLSNFELKGAYEVSAADLGVYDMSFDGDGCHAILDEASDDFDNRQFKAFASSPAKSYFSFHRHQNNMVDVFSQGYDVDKRIRDRASAAGLFHLRRSPFPGFVFYRQIKKILFIKKEDKQIVDGFEYKGLPRFIYSRSIWSDFDTLDLTHCPKVQKQWRKWDDITETPANF